MATSLKSLDNGTIISFQSKNASDQVQWRGTLEGRGSYRSIVGYGDPRSFNEAVRQSDPTVSSDVTKLNYFLIAVDNESSNTIIKAFAEEWIEEGSLVVILPGNQVSITVDDPFNDSQKILSLLASAGYAATITNN